MSSTYNSGLPEKTVRIIQKRSPNNEEPVAFIEFQRFIEGTLALRIVNADLKLDIMMNLGMYQHIQKALDDFFKS